MNVLGPVIGGLAFAAAFYTVTRIRLRRALDADHYRQETADRMAAAPWRPHLSVVVDADGSYSYTAPRPEQEKGGGSDEARARLGVVAGGSLAGGKGSPSGLPHKAIRRRCSCGEVDGHTGQCFVVSYITDQGETFV